MKINLRTAASIQQALRTEIDAINESTNLDAMVSIYDNIFDIVPALAESVKQNMQRAEELVSALFEIRQKVAEANATNGVNTILNDIAKLEARAKLYQKAEHAEARDELNSVAAFFEDSKESVKTGSSITRHKQHVNIIAKADLDEMNSTYRNIKRSAQKSKDKLLAINLTSEITLSDETAQLLTSAGLV